MFRVLRTMSKEQITWMIRLAFAFLPFFIRFGHWHLGDGTGRWLFPADLFLTSAAIIAGQWSAAVFLPRNADVDHAVRLSSLPFGFILAISITAWPYHAASEAGLLANKWWLFSPYCALTLTIITVCMFNYHVTRTLSAVNASRVGT